MAKSPTAVFRGDPVTALHEPDPREIVELFESLFAFDTRTGATSSTVDGSMSEIDVIHDGLRLRYVRDDSGTALITADSAKWSPAESDVNPLYWGAVRGGLTSQSSALQAMLDWARAQYDTDLGCFSVEIDLLGASWVVGTSLNLTNLRQPGLVIKNGTLVGRCAGQVVLDCLGSNHVTFKGVRIEGARDAIPTVGLQIGRAALGGNPTPIAPNVTCELQTDGYFSKSALVNVGSEVFRGKLHLTNKHWSNNAYCYAAGGRANVFDKHMGGVASLYATPPAQANGNFSNILHDLGDAVLMRSSDYAVNIQNISQTNPVVVTVDPAAMVAAGMANGDAINFHDGGVPSQLKHRRLTVTSINTTLGTFAINEDGTGYDAYTSGGRVWRATGPAVLFGSGRGLVIREGAYLLSYGAETVRLDGRYGDLNGIVIKGQHEASPTRIVTVDVDGANAIMQGLVLETLLANQDLSGAALYPTGTGTLRLDMPSIVLPSHAGTGVAIGNRTIVTVNMGHIRVVAASDVAGMSDFPSFSGVVEITSTDESRFYGLNPDVRSVLDGSTDGPILNLRRDRTTHSASDPMGYLRFLMGTTSVGGIRSRVTDVTAGAEESRIEAVVKDAGSDVVSAYFDAVVSAGESGAVIICNIGGTVSMKRVRIGAAGTGPGGSGHALYLT